MCALEQRFLGRGGGETRTAFPQDFLPVERTDMKHITLVGCGGLGAALARALAKEPRFSLTVVEKHPEKVVAAVGEGGARFVADGTAGVRGADLVVLAVKPQVTPGVLAALAPGLAPGALVVSCAAGVTLRSLCRSAPGVAVARAMPNTGAALGVSTTALCLGGEPSQDHHRRGVAEVFGVMGEVLFLEDEDLLHAATAVAGSGPAFFLRALEGLLRGAAAAGLREADAHALATGALRAASALVDRGGASPEELRRRITSPKGTTAAGLAVMEEARLPGAFQDAVAAAVERSRELSQDTKET